MKVLGRGPCSSFRSEPSVPRAPRPVSPSTELAMEEVYKYLYSEEEDQFSPVSDVDLDDPANKALLDSSDDEDSGKAETEMLVDVPSPLYSPPGGSSVVAEAGDVPGSKWTAGDATASTPPNFTESEASSFSDQVSSGGRATSSSSEWVATADCDAGFTPPAARTVASLLAATETSRGAADAAAGSPVLPAPRSLGRGRGVLGASD